MRAKFYLYVSIIGSLSACLSVLNSNAQSCGCGPGVDLDSTVQTITFDSIVALNTNITFNKFNASGATLTCLKLGSTVTSVLYFDLYNKDSAKSSPTDYVGNPTDYRFRTFRESSYTGPGGFYQETLSPTVFYGTYSLQPPNTIDPTDSSDEIHEGPDTAFYNQYTETNKGTGMANYLGAGTFDFNYLNTSTTTMVLGSSNYDFFVRAYSRLTVRLVYYSCPQTALALRDKKKSLQPNASSDPNITQALTTYPNPLSGNNFSLQFNKAVTGTYIVDIVNVTGQKIYSRSLQINNTNLVPIDLAATPPPGLYYLRATDQRTGVTHINKLFVK